MEPLTPTIIPIQQRFKRIEERLVVLECPLLGVSPNASACDLAQASSTPADLHSSRTPAGDAHPASELRLKVNIQSADLTAIPSMDMGSKSDPYCVLSTRERIHGKTKPMPDTDRPIWKEEIEVWNLPVGQPLEFDIFDCDPWPKLDDRIAHGTLHSDMFYPIGRFEGPVDLKPAHPNSSTEGSTAVLMVGVEAHHPTEEETLKHYDDHKKEEEKFLHDLVVFVEKTLPLRAVMILMFMLAGHYELTKLYYPLLVCFSAVIVKRIFSMLNTLKHQTHIKAVHDVLKEVMHGESHLSSCSMPSCWGRSCAKCWYLPDFPAALSRVKLIVLSLMNFAEVFTSAFSASWAFRDWKKKEEEMYEESWAQSPLPWLQYCTLPQIILMLFVLKAAYSFIHCCWYTRLADKKIKEFTMSKGKREYLLHRHQFWRYLCMASTSAGLAGIATVSGKMVKFIAELGGQKNDKLRRSSSFGGDHGAKHAQISLHSEHPLDTSVFINHLVLLGAKSWFNISFIANRYERISSRPTVFGSFVSAAMFQIVSLGIVNLFFLAKKFYTDFNGSTEGEAGREEIHLRRLGKLAVQCIVFLSSGGLVVALAARLMGVWWCPSHVLNLYSGCVAAL